MISTPDHHARPSSVGKLPRLGPNGREQRLGYLAYRMIGNREEAFRQPDTS
jgi:hypothetical protein